MALEQPSQVNGFATSGKAVTRAGSAPAWLGSKTGSVRAARFSVLDRAAAQRAGINGVLLRIGRADGQRTPGTLAMRLDYRGFRDAFGGGWASRLRLSRVPECALLTPGATGCQVVPLPSLNEHSTASIRADIPLAATAGDGLVNADGSLFALSAAPSSDGGAFTATPMQASSTWSAGDQAGDFNWSYPFRSPPAQSGPEPTIGLSYSSQSLDGRTAASNSQPSWAGDGFDYSTGFVERSYKACTDDGKTNVGDLCWGTDNAVLSVPGHGGQLIQVSTSPDVWKLKKDDGTRVERLTDTINGDNDNEYWRVTTPDGTRYFLGLNRLPGWSAGKPETNSTFTVPVYGNNAGEPCNTTPGWCQQAYRWNLDYVIDTHDNTMSFWYTREQNNYGRNATSTAVSSYTRGGQVQSIKYGTRKSTTGVDEVYTGNAPAQVVFATADRCVTPGATCVPSAPSNWPDVPWDQQCNSTTNCGDIYSPTFFSQKRLATVTTQVYNGMGYRDVERWTLNHTFKDPGDGQAKLLWLSGIQHTGLAVSGSPVDLPETTFGGIQMANRVDTSPTKAPIIRFRISSIANESGGVLSINYSAKECVIGGVMPTNPHTNTKRCFPAWWTPYFQSTPTFDWFHKYVVDSVTFSDTAGNAPNQEYRYAYSSAGPMWHYDDTEMVIPAHKSWGQWRGYSKVRVTVGAGSSRQMQTDTIYYQGMHGDKLPSGTRVVTIPADPDFTGTTAVNDEDWFMGSTRETIVYNGTGDAAEVVGKTLMDQWGHGPTATRTRNGVTTNAYILGTKRITDLTKLDGGRGWRTGRTTHTFDAEDGLANPMGRFTKVDEENDIADTSDDACTRYTYATNPTANLLTAVSRMETVSVRCATTPSRPADIIGDSRSYYDGSATLGSVTKGELTKSEKITDWVSGQPVYATVARMTYDVHGRMLDSFDGLDRKSSNAYTPSVGGPVTATSMTNPMGWTTTSLIDPAYGQPTKRTDVNGKVTEATYDGLGRLTDLWTPGRVKGTHTPTTKYSYLIRKSGGPSAISTSFLNTEGTGYLITYSLYDGQMRPRQTQQPAHGGGRTITDTLYDSRGLEVQSHVAYYNASAPSNTLFTPSGPVPGRTLLSYDNAGRVTDTVFQINGVEYTRTITRYGGDRTDVLPPAGAAASSTWMDELDRTTKMRMYRGSTLTGTSDDTTFTYAHGEQLESATDAAGNVWSFEYDLRGRRTREVDPDRGTLTSTYDNADQRLTATDGRGILLTVDYDALGRKTGLYQGSVATGTKLAGWTYDTLAKGQLTSSTRHVGSANYTLAITGYDDTYRATGSSMTIPSTEGSLAGTYTTATTYKPNGQVATMTMPAIGGLPAETITYGYNTLGTPTTMSGLNTYITGVDYDSLGRIGTRQLSDGGGKTLTEIFAFEDGTNRLFEHGILDDAAARVYQDVFYEYNSIGTLKSIKDKTNQYGAGADDNQCFQYDYAQRLAQAWTPGNGNCDTGPTVAALGGPAPYWQSFTYDELTGNRKTRTDHTAAGASVKTSTYPAATAVRPHAVNQVVTTGLGAGTDTYTYDNAGNLITRNRAGKPGQTLTWDAEGRLASVTEAGGGTSSYIYGADGNRLLAKDPGSTTLYLAGQELKRTGTTLSATRFYGKHAVRTTTGGLHWTTSDHHGTNNLMFRASDLTVTQRRAAPFGEARGADPTWVSTKTFVGGTKDLTGLVHIGAREYDAGLGRFVSADPVFDLSDPQSWNNYAYALNNPVTNSDPTGEYNQRDSGQSVHHRVLVGTRQWSQRWQGARAYYITYYFALCRNDGSCIRNNDIVNIIRQGPYALFEETVLIRVVHDKMGPYPGGKWPDPEPGKSSPSGDDPAPKAKQFKCGFGDVVECVKKRGFKEGLKGWWRGNKDWVTGVAGAVGGGICVIATAGACAIAGAVGLGISLAGRGLDVWATEDGLSWDTWNRMLWGAAIDFAGSRIPGVRAFKMVGKGTWFDPLQAAAKPRTWRSPSNKVSLSWREQFTPFGGIETAALRRGAVGLGGQSAWWAVTAPAAVAPWQDEKPWTDPQKWAF